VLLCASLATVGTVASTESGRYRWGLLLGPLTTRIRRDEVLDNRTRYALHGYIREHPGIHYNALMREFDLKNGAAAYHLSVLEKENYVRSVRDGRLKRFYSTDSKVPAERRLPPEEIKEAIIDLVSQHPGISQKEIVDELEIDNETIRYHIRPLVEEGQLSASKSGRYTIYHRET
jgi:predicted transcriptional regulator